MSSAHGDVDRSLGPINRPLPGLGAIGGVPAVDAAWIFPQPRCDELGHQPLVVQHFLEFSGFLLDLRTRLVVHVRHRVVVVELDALEPQSLVGRQLVGKLDRRTHRWDQTDRHLRGCSRVQRKIDTHWPWSHSLSMCNDVYRRVFDLVSGSLPSALSIWPTLQLGSKPARRAVSA